MKLYSQVKIQSCLFLLLTLISILIFGCSKELSKNDTINIENDKERLILKLNLRIHIMSDIIMIHPSGLNMPSWISNEDVSEIILPEINSIWEQADIKWKIESIVQEDVVKSELYEESIAFISNTKRDLQGRSNPKRLPSVDRTPPPGLKVITLAIRATASLLTLYFFSQSSA